MATAKKSTKPVTKTKAAPAKASKAPKKAVRSAAAPKAAASSSMKPIKDTFNKSSLTQHLAQTAGVEPKAVKAVMAALESTMLASIHKKGAGSFQLPGLLKVTAVAVPARKARRGINPFTKEETVFKAKPASVKLKVRALKKLTDAAA